MLSLLSPQVFRCSTVKSVRSAEHAAEHGIAGGNPMKIGLDAGVAKLRHEQCVWEPVTVLIIVCRQRLPTRVYLRRATILNQQHADEDNSEIIFFAACDILSLTRQNLLTASLYTVLLFFVNAFVCGIDISGRLSILAVIYSSSIISGPGKRR